MTFADYMASVNAQKICDEIEGSRPGEANPSPPRDTEHMSEGERAEAEALGVSEAEYKWQRERDSKRREGMVKASEEASGWAFFEALLKEDE